MEWLDSMFVQGVTMIIVSLGLLGNIIISHVRWVRQQA